MKAVKQGAGNGEQGIDLSKPWAGMVPTASVVRNPEQPRVKFPKDELARLALSLTKQGQTSPCVVIPVPEKLKRHGAAWLLVDGECRWRAAKDAGLPEILVCYQPGVTEANLHLASFAANFCRTPHTKQETALAVAKEREAGRSYEEIGAVVGKTGAWAEQFHTLLKLDPQLLQWMDEADPACGRKLAMRVALLLVAHPPEKQVALWKRLRHHETAEMYHKVRVTGVVGADRSTTDDRRYLQGKLRTAGGLISAVAEAGEVMLRRLTPDQRQAVMDSLIDVEAACTKARARLEKHHVEGEA